MRRQYHSRKPGGTWQQALEVVSNAMAEINAHRLLADSISSQLQRSDRGLVVWQDVVTTEGQTNAATAMLEVSLNTICLEGGVKPNPKLWLTLDWSAQLRFADNPALVYTTGGVWQSDEERNLRNWATEDGARLRGLLHEASSQIAAVIVGQILHE